MDWHHTEKYWLTSLLPVQGEALKYSFKAIPAKTPDGKTHYQVDMMGTERVVGAGEKIEFVSHVYAGAKKVYPRPVRRPPGCRTSIWRWISACIIS